jgi:hypothetical protein
LRGCHGLHLNAPRLPSRQRKVGIRSGFPRGLLNSTSEGSQRSSVNAQLTDLLLYAKRIQAFRTIIYTNFNKPLGNAARIAPSGRGDCESSLTLHGRARKERTSPARAAPPLARASLIGRSMHFARDASGAAAPAIRSRCAPSPRPGPNRAVPPAIPI